MTLALTVAISTRNRPDVLDRCLRALLDAEADPAEIVVVDQSSDEATRGVVEALPPSDVEVAYVRHDGRGLGASQNVAVRTARQAVVAVLDDDCVPGPGWAARVAGAFEADPDLGLLTGRVLPLGPAAPDLHPVSSRTSTRPTTFDTPTAPWSVGSGNNFAVRRADFLAIGGCDERLGPGSPARGGVDMDLFYRLLRRGTKGRYDPEVVVYHEQVSREGRLERRPMYGFGTGACFALWVRQGDPRALPLLVHWLGWRGWKLARAAVHGEWDGVHEEALMLGWTFPGVLHGLRAPGPHPEAGSAKSG